jgi:TonB family protein
MISTRLILIVLVVIIMSACSGGVNKTASSQIDYLHLPSIDYKNLKVIYEPNLDDYYSKKSKENDETGEVVIRIIIDSDGKVKDVQLLKSSNYPRLDRAAYDIGLKYKFEPYQQNGKSIVFRTQLLVTFKLH